VHQVGNQYIVVDSSVCGTHDAAMSVCGPVFFRCSRWRPSASVASPCRVKDTDWRAVWTSRTPCCMTNKCYKLISSAISVLAWLDRNWDKDNGLLECKGKGHLATGRGAQGVPGRLRPRIFLTFGTTRLVSRQPYAPAAFTSGEIPGTHFQRLSRPQGTCFRREEPRKKILSDTIGNRFRDRPTSSTVPSRMWRSVIC